MAHEWMIEGFSGWQQCQYRAWVEGDIAFMSTVNSTEVEWR